MTSILTALHIISKEAKHDPHRRYIAKHFANGKQDRWWVFDQKEGRYLKEREIESLTRMQLREGL